MTYDKTLKTVEIETKSGGTFTVADTVDNAVGSAVWDSIVGGGKILYKDGDKWQFIANDCICSASYTTSTTEVTKEDCEPIDPCADDTNDGGTTEPTEP